jgi:hypothetical protein
MATINWENEANKSVQLLLNGEVMNIDNQFGEGVREIKYHYHHEGNFLEIRDNLHHCKRPFMNEQELRNYIKSLYNPNIVRHLGSANPRFINKN